MVLHLLKNAQAQHSCAGFWPACAADACVCELFRELAGLRGEDGTCCGDAGPEPEHSCVEASEIQDVPAQQAPLEHHGQQVLPGAAVPKGPHGLVEQVAHCVQRLP